MIRYLLALLVACATPAYAQIEAAQRLLIKFPITTVLTVGQWLIKDQEKVYYIRVVSTGKDDQLAKEQGFRTAVEHAVGSLVASHTEVKSNQLTRNEIISYSSGYVKEFNILSRNRHEDGSVTLDLEIWVKHSDIASRLFVSKEKSLAIQGENLDAAHQTLMRERQQGDKLLLEILKDYPYRAYQIDQHSVSVYLDHLRRPVLQLKFAISWDQNWLISLSEALNQTSTRQCWASTCPDLTALRVTSKSWGGLLANVAFDDRARFLLLYQGLIGSQPSLEITVVNLDGSMAHRSCINYAELDGSQKPMRVPHRRLTEVGERAIHFNGKNKFLGQVDVVLDPTKLVQLGNATTKIVRLKECV